MRIEEAHVVTSVREGTITVETEARNESQTRFAGRVAWQITRSGQTELELPACEIDVAPGEVQMVRVSAPWHHPVQWGRPPYGEPVIYIPPGHARWWWAAGPRNSSPLRLPRGVGGRGLSAAQRRATDDVG